jgi:3-hydroxybutyryl-CoA dehydratase
MTTGRLIESLDNPFEFYEIGDHFVTGSRTVTEADVVNYCGLSGDFSPLHVDADYARSTPYGERIAHGQLLISMASGMEFLLLTPAHYAGALYGYDRIRFVKGVPVGETIHVEGTVAALREKGEQFGIVTFHEEVLNSAGDVCAVWDKILTAKRAGAVSLAS